MFRLLLPILLLAAAAGANPTELPPQQEPQPQVSVSSEPELPAVGSEASVSADATIEASISDAASASASPSSLPANLDPDQHPFDLERAETKANHDPHPPKLEIIKQIRRLNSDGSYTVGYEADDGTFKIESRDVLGNVKGTYGYVDVNGEIKRVSYTAGTNASSAQRGVAQVKTVADENAPPRNRTAGAAGAASASTTRRPASLAFLTTAQQASPTRATVIQAIPKKSSSRIAQSSSERPTYNHHANHHYASTPRHQHHQSNDLVSSPAPRKAVAGEPTTTVVYATSLPTNRPPQPQQQQQSINIRPTALPGAYKTSDQLMRPDKLEITDHVSKVQISSQRDQSTAKPVTELVDEKDLGPVLSSSEEKRSTRGSFQSTARPTASAPSAVGSAANRDAHDEAVEAQQQVIYSQSAGDDSSHVYSGNPNSPSSVTSRPVFSGTPTTRIPSAVLAARSRVAQLQNAIQQQQLAKQQQQEKVYIKPPRRRVEVREDTALDQSTAAEPSSENHYVSAQRPAAVQIVAPPSAASSNEEEKRVYRRPVAYAQNSPQAYRTREFVRQAPPPSPDYEYSAGPRQFRIPIPQAAYLQPQQQQPRQYETGGRPVYTEQLQQREPSSQDDRIDEQPQQQQYLRETTVMSARPAAAASTTDPEYPGYRQRGNGRQYLPYPVHGQQAVGPHLPHGDDGGYDPYGPPLHHPHQHQIFQNPDRPLTARDFERLLNLLVIRHQQLQRYQHNPYLSPAYHHQPHQFGGGGGYQQQIPRPPIYNQYDPRLTGLIRPPLYGDFSDQDAAYQQPPSTTSASSAGQPERTVEIGQRLVARTQQQPKQRPFYYATAASERPALEYSEQQSAQAQAQALQDGHLQQQQQSTEYLPADIREELLYRMLLLAMQPGQNGQTGDSSTEQTDGSSPEYAALGTTTSKPAQSGAGKFARKPVRSVQILGEE